MVRLSEALSGFPRPVDGEPGDAGLFGPGSAAWAINAKTALLSGGGRALLLQIAHPMVGAGVADHSGFDRDPWERLWGTLDAVLSVTFADTPRAHDAARRVTAKHRNVKGVRDGVAYQAMDPELLMWVHATLVDSALVAYGRLVGPVSEGEAHRYYQDMKVFAREFGVPDDRIPSDLAAFREYFSTAVAGLQVSEDARRLAPLILEPPVPRWAEPARAVQRLITIGLLPSSVRDGFGFRWSGPRARAFHVACSGVRFGQKVLPRSVTTWPHARKAAIRAASTTDGHDF